MGLFIYLLFFLSPFCFGFPNRNAERQPEGDFMTTEFFLSTTSEPEEENFCPPNEFFSPCLAHCQGNCTNWSDPSTICLKICVPGCICNNGMVRGPYGNCIQPRRCPQRRDSSESVPGDMFTDCPVDEHYDTCNAHCQRNCSNWDQGAECTQNSICVSGCVCDEGFVRGSNGKCVLTEKCSLLNQKLQLSTKAERKNNVNLGDLSTEKSLNSCPDGELRSSLRSIRDSNVYCISANGSFQFCPPTFLNGCVCKRGQIRTTDSQQCMDHRLQPNANEILFMREPSERSSNFEFLEESFDFNVLFEDSTFASTTTFTSDISTVEINENKEENDTTTTILQETATDLISTIDTNVELQGCPDPDICFEWCQAEGFSRGSCEGVEFQNSCSCFQVKCACFRDFKMQVTNVEMIH